MKKKAILILTAVMLVVVLSMGTTLLHIKQTHVNNRVLTEKSLVATIDKTKLVNQMDCFRLLGSKVEKQWGKVPPLTEVPQSILHSDWYFESSDKRKNYLCYYEESEFFDWKLIQNKYIKYSG